MFSHNFVKFTILDLNWYSYKPDSTAFIFMVKFLGILTGALVSVMFQVISISDLK